MQDTPIKQVYANKEVPRLGKMWVVCDQKEAELTVPAHGNPIIGAWVTPSASSSV